MNKPVTLTKELRRLWVPRRIFSESPPYMEEPYLGVGCRMCTNTYNRFVSAEFLMNGCPECTPKITGHRLRNAWIRHTANNVLRSHMMVREDRWVFWVNNPYQPEIQPDYQLWKQSGTDVPFRDFINFEVPKVPADAPIEYLASESGLSYQQWVDRPDHLRHHLKTDVRKKIYLGEDDRPLEPGEKIVVAGGEVTTYDHTIKPIEILRRN